MIREEEEEFENNSINFESGNPLYRSIELKGLKGRDSRGLSRSNPKGNFSNYPSLRNWD